MNKQVFTKLHHVIFTPRKYFRDVISSNSFQTKDLILINLILITSIAVLHFIHQTNLNEYTETSTLAVYLISLTLGLVALFSIRTYFITIILKKARFKIDLHQVGMIVSISMITSFVLILISVLFPMNPYTMSFEVIMKLWNFILILVGIGSLIKVHPVRSFFFIVFFIFSSEWLIILPFMRIRF